MEEAGVELKPQPALVVARAAAYLMADGSRQGDVIYVAEGKYKEVEKSILLPAFDKIRGDGSLNDDEVLGQLLEIIAKQSKNI